VEGSIMRYNKIAFVGHPARPTQDAACKAAPEGPLSRKDDFSNTGSSTAKTAGYTGDAEPAMYTGLGDVYLGDVWVSGGMKCSRFESGRFQLVYVRELNEQPVPAAPENYFVAKPYGLLLQLHEDGGYVSQR
jgi:hypothetical protein